ncbi:MAG TPA: hypothetical protein VNB22_17430 [Pyrinomonadaceae bacterium]|nr:hypothetical protein [Pyrinomonadaceae bacterium]
MHRYPFYLMCALVTFGVGLFVSIGFYLKPFEKNDTAEAQKRTENVVPRGSFVEEPVFYETSQEPADDEKEIPVCRDKRLTPLWNELKKDKTFRESVDYFDVDADCSEMLELQKTDLNGDGQKEFILWGSNLKLCGGTGNCHIWIYEKKKGKYKLLLQSVAYNDASKWFEPKKAKSNGYRNILLKTHSTAAETTYQFYKFNGAKYVEYKCLMYKYTLDEKKPSIKPCREYSEY